MPETPEEQPENERPLTREDVLRLIEENGGTAQGLDLSGQVFEDHINLSGMDLAGIILKGAKLRGANLEDAKLGYWPEYKGHYVGDNTFDLQGAYLEDANLQRAVLVFANLREANLIGANLTGANATEINLLEAKLENAILRDGEYFRANFQDANLIHVDFQKAELSEANLRGAYLEGAKLEGAKMKDAKISGAHLYGVEMSTDQIASIDWDGKYFVAEEEEQVCENKKAVHVYHKAVRDYRTLRTRYTQLGMGDIAGQFFYREMECRRKALPWWPHPWKKLWLGFLGALCGYGEHWHKVIVSGLTVLLGLTLVYSLFGGLPFWNALYFSAVSFTALGYGFSLHDTGIPDWAHGLGAAEALIGTFMTALFLTTFVRKMTR